MKKLSFLPIIIVLCLILTGCSNSDEPMKTSNEYGVSHSLIRTESEAVEIAISHMEGRAGVDSRSGYTVKNVDIIGGSSSRSMEDTLIYAINFTNDRGFVLVSAAKRGEDIIGYADTGQINVADFDSNPGFAFYMDAARDYVYNATLLPIDTTVTPFIPQPDPEVSYEKITPRVEVEWGQDDPEGYLFANNHCGCVQTACLQMLTVFKQPTEVVYTYPGHSIVSESIDWNALCNHKKSNHHDYKTGYLYSNCEATPESHFQIGRIAREMGYRNNADDSKPNGTSTKDILARNTMRSWLPDNFYVSDFTKLNISYDNLFNILKRRKTVIYMRGETSNGEGHAWICSGGERITIVHHDDLYLHGDKEIKTYFHFNWGWEGYCNGYFTAGVFNTSNSVIPSRADFVKNYYYFYVYPTIKL